MRRCYLVRHAQTVWNGENRLQGHSDLPLSALGERQARQLGARFASLHVAGLFSSTLQRSRQTAQQILEGNGHQVNPVMDHGLMEMHLGAWEGLTPQEIDGRFDGAYQRWIVQPSSVVIPNGEPLDAFRLRVRQAWSRVLATIEGGDGEYVVVSHGGVIAAMLADALAADYDILIRRLRLDNAGITAIDCDGRMPHVLWINSTTHLRTDGPGPSD